MRQLSLSLLLPKKRRRTGPKPRVERTGFAVHRARPAHDFRHPVHVTIRRVRLAPDFRTECIRAVVLHELSRARAKGVRVVQYSIQSDHVHLIVEGADAADLSAQMRTLFSRVAMMVNQAAGRRGSLFRDRHHRHALKTPREVRNALVYVLFNARKHQRDHAAEAQALHDAPDPCSSAPWFRHWAADARPPPELVRAVLAGLPAEAPVTASSTWLGEAGWARAGGPIRFDERPRRRL